MRTLGQIFLMSGLVLAAGCGSSDPRLAISGTVQFKGKPLDQGRIEFHPPDNKGTMSGAEVVNGKYAFPRTTGLAPNTYEVRIFSYDEKGQKLEAVPGEPGIGFKERIPRKYNLDSKLKAEVKPGQTNFDFTLD